MNRAEILRKAEANEGLTVKEIKIYQKTVKPEKHVYGKYGNLAKQYLQDKGIDWTIANLPEYLHGVDDRQTNFMTRCMKSSRNRSVSERRAILWRT